MAESIITHRRNLLKLISAAAVAGISPVAARATAADDHASALIASIQTPKGATKLSITIKSPDAGSRIEACCVSEIGDVLYLNPRTGAWS
jgi:hypothetical protein